MTYNIRNLGDLAGKKVRVEGREEWEEPIILEVFTYTCTLLVVKDGMGTIVPEIENKLIHIILEDDQA